MIHPQERPKNLGYAGKHVLATGSGATAVTLVPRLAETAAEVVMFQRTPSYVLPLPSRDKLALRLRHWLGDERAYPLIRRKNITRQRVPWRFSRRFPNAMRRFVRNVSVKQLPQGYPVGTHVNPPYQPWDQRLCLVPNGDFLSAIRAGTAEVVTDKIRQFTATGVLLESGRVIDTDIVVNATGLNVRALGGVELTVDGERVDMSERVSFKGMMLSGARMWRQCAGRMPDE